MTRDDSKMFMVGVDHGNSLGDQTVVIGMERESNGAVTITSVIRGEPSKIPIAVGLTAYWVHSDDFEALKAECTEVREQLLTAGIRLIPSKLVPRGRLTPVPQLRDKTLLPLP